ncbi:MAG: 4-hydroxy-tetrahydrodipicolinate reductase [Nitrospiraceae bacterium]|nr:4-hydroxy-tetrahydrodipicolinate reductase [Nitrospira sp.]MCB9774470.1 4-hydroxy-tetrahydrodipicolinate reductase [Nitrospiraceae bacterium]
MIRTIITGAAGRMGMRLVALTQATPGLQLSGAVEVKGHPAIGKDAGEVAQIGQVNIPITDDLQTCLSQSDVVVDFTAPSSCLANLEHAVKSTKAMVIGTTGFTDQELAQLKTFALKIPCVFSPNMSVGINVLLSTVGKIARSLGEQYNIEVIEAHHNKKKDAPSGTALKLAEALAEGMDWDIQEVGVYTRHGMTGERKTREIGMQTIRAGDIVGDHTILLGGPGERIEITHRAHTRDTFAQGALRAAEWVAHKPPGLYSMADVLDLS